MLNHFYIEGCGCTHCLYEKDRRLHEASLMTYETMMNSCFGPVHVQTKVLDSFASLFPEDARKENKMSGSLCSDRDGNVTVIRNKMDPPQLEGADLYYCKPYVISKCVMAGAVHQIGDVVIKFRVPNCTDWRLINMTRGYVVSDPSRFNYALDPSIDHVRIV